MTPKNTVTKQCATCGQKFAVRPDRYDRTVYCSRECAFTGMRKVRRCKACGVQMFGRSAKVRKFCQECSTWRLGKMPTTCIACGKRFFTLWYRPRVTCSKECLSKAVIARQVGEKSHFWKGGKTDATAKARNSTEYDSWRRTVFARDDYTCQMCNTRGGTLTAHHIIPVSKRPALMLVVNNGITLCWTCHSSIRNKERHYAPQFVAAVRAKK